MSYNIFASEFWEIKVIIPQSVLDKLKKKMLFLDIISVCEELVIVF